MSQDTLSYSRFQSVNNIQCDGFNSLDMTPPRKEVKSKEIPDFTRQLEPNRVVAESVLPYASGGAALDLSKEWGGVGSINVNIPKLKHSDATFSTNCNFRGYNLDLARKQLERRADNVIFERVISNYCSCWQECAPKLKMYEPTVEEIWQELSVLKISRVCALKGDVAEGAGRMIALKKIQAIVKATKHAESAEVGTHLAQQSQDSLFEKENTSLPIVVPTGSEQVLAKSEATLVLYKASTTGQKTASKKTEKQKAAEAEAQALDTVVDNQRKKRRILQRAVDQRRKLNKKDDDDDEANDEWNEKFLVVGFLPPIFVLNKQMSPLAPLYAIIDLVIPDVWYGDRFFTPEYDISIMFRCAFLFVTTSNYEGKQTRGAIHRNGQYELRGKGSIQYTKEYIIELFAFINSKPDRTPGSTSELFEAVAYILRSLSMPPFQQSGCVLLALLDFILARASDSNVGLPGRPPWKSYINTLTTIFSISQMLYLHGKLDLDFVEYVYKSIGMRDLIVPLLPTGQDCLPRTSAPRTAPLEWIDPHYSEFPDNPQGHFCSDVDDGLLSDFQCYRYSLDRHRNTTLPKPTNFTASKAEEIITAVKVFARYERYSDQTAEFYKSHAGTYKRGKFKSFEYTVGRFLKSEHPRLKAGQHWLNDVVGQSFQINARPPSSLEADIYVNEKMKEINYAKWEETLMLDVIPEEGLKISAWTGFGELLGFKSIENVLVTGTASTPTPQLYGAITTDIEKITHDRKKAAAAKGLAELEAIKRRRLRARQRGNQPEAVVDADQQSEPEIVFPDDSQLGDAMDVDEVRPDDDNSDIVNLTNNLARLGSNAAANTAPGNYDDHDFDNDFDSFRAGENRQNDFADGGTGVASEAERLNELEAAGRGFGGIPVQGTRFSQLIHDSRELRTLQGRYEDLQKAFKDLQLESDEQRTAHFALVRDKAAVEKNLEAIKQNNQSHEQEVQRLKNEILQLTNGTSANDIIKSRDATITQLHQGRIDDCERLTAQVCELTVSKQELEQRCQELARVNDKCLNEIPGLKRSATQLRDQVNVLDQQVEEKDAIIENYKNQIIDFCTANPSFSTTFTLHDSEPPAGAEVASPRRRKGLRNQNAASQASSQRSGANSQASIRSVLMPARTIPSVNQEAILQLINRIQLYEKLAERNLPQPILASYIKDGKRSMYYTNVPPLYGNQILQYFNGDENIKKMYDTNQANYPIRISGDRQCCIPKEGEIITQVRCMNLENCLGTHWICNPCHQKQLKYYDNEIEPVRGWNLQKPDEENVRVTGTAGTPKPQLYDRQFFCFTCTTMTSITTNTGWREVASPKGDFLHYANASKKVVRIPPAPKKPVPYRYQQPGNIPVYSKKRTQKYKEAKERRKHMLKQAAMTRREERVRHMTLFPLLRNYDDNVQLQLLTEEMNIGDRCPWPQLIERDPPAGGEESTGDNLEDSDGEESSNHSLQDVAGGEEDDGGYEDDDSHDGGSEESFNDGSVEAAEDSQASGESEPSVEDDADLTTNFDDPDSNNTAAANASDSDGVFVDGQYEFDEYPQHYWEAIGVYSPERRREILDRIESGIPGSPIPLPDVIVDNHRTGPEGAVIRTATQIAYESAPKPRRRGRPPGSGKKGKKAGGGRGKGTKGGRGGGTKGAANGGRGGGTTGAASGGAASVAADAANAAPKRRGRPRKNPQPE